MVGPSSLLSVSPFLSPRLIAGAFVFGADAERATFPSTTSIARRRAESKADRAVAALKWTLDGHRHPADFVIG